MSMEVQPGVAIKYVAGEAIENAYNKAVVYGPDEGEVLLGTDDDTKFAGIVISVTAGKTDALEGDNIGVVNDGIIEVKADGAISFGDALAIGTDGLVKAIPEADGTPTAALIMQMIGRAQEDAEDGAVFKALVFCRK